MKNGKNRRRAAGMGRLIKQYETELNIAAEILEWEIGDIWGIGHQHATRLKARGINTAKHFTSLPGNWVREQMGVVGLRLWHDLRGEASIQWECEPKAKKNICTSRSLGIASLPE